MQRIAAVCHTQVEVWTGILQGRMKVSERQESPADSEVDRRT